MHNKHTTYLSDADLYKGFGFFSKRALRYWRNRIVRYGEVDKLQSVFDRLNNDLLSGNLIIFFDHHYAFDAIPLGLALAQFVKFAKGVLIPYSVHLEMGIGREGQPSLNYFLRTQAFRWFIGKIKKPNPDIQFFPVVREFELDNPRLCAIVDQRFSGVNTIYLKAFLRIFAHTSAGQVCFLTPFSGIGFPGKPLLHPQLYRSVDLVQQKCKQRFPMYILGAYPSWQAYSNYIAPLINEHLIVMRGPFFLPKKDYQAALEVMSAEIAALRQDGNFSPPDYERILNK